jgi:hypothetical protein
MTARDIEKLLKKKHVNDIFVAQCKTGPSVTGVQIFDGWALKPSWTNQLAIGYEIKVSKSDFIRDEKWRGYLPFCNEFYFVTPSGLVEKDEIPNGCGWMVASGSRLLTKKKAEYHEADHLESLYKYILMYHSNLIKNDVRFMTREERIENWKKKIEEKEALDVLGHYVSRSLKRYINKEIVDVRRENQRLTHENERLTIVKNALKNLGLDLHSIPMWNPERTITERLNEIENGISEKTLVALSAARLALEKIEELIN